MSAGVIGQCASHDLRRLRHYFIAMQRAMNVRKAAATKHALVRHPPEARGQPSRDGQVFLVDGRKPRVTTFGLDDRPAVARATDQLGDTEAGAGPEHGDRAAQ